MSDPEIPVIEAPATVIAPASTTGAEWNGLPRRLVEKPLAPTTTAEEDRHSENQREVNMTWENTQRIIALSVTWAALSVACWLAIMGSTESVQTAALVFVFGVANLVIGFYFGRTNHQRVGGIELGR